ncbi:MAG TPA: hypothetical protein VKE70_09755, partial [Candidatus Solibacter sp.]|nr:hypothetical protein [Candidatus Solibacter sp.]
LQAEGPRFEPASAHHFQTARDVIDPDIQCTRMSSGTTPDKSRPLRYRFHGFTLLVQSGNPTRVRLAVRETVRI